MESLHLGKRETMDVIGDGKFVKKVYTTLQINPADLRRHCEGCLSKKVTKCNFSKISMIQLKKSIL